MLRAVGAFTDQEGQVHNRWEEVKTSNDDEPVDILDLLNTIPSRPSSAELREATRFDEIGDTPID